MYRSDQEKKANAQPFLLFGRSPFDSMNLLRSTEFYAHARINGYYIGKTVYISKRCQSAINITQSSRSSTTSTTTTWARRTGTPYMHLLCCHRSSSSWCVCLCWLCERNIFYFHIENRHNTNWKRCYSPADTSILHMPMHLLKRVVILAGFWAKNFSARNTLDR